MSELQNNILQSSPRVLVVDDEAHIVQVVALKLRNAGIEVATAFDGEEALALLRSSNVNSPFQLVLTDLQMPGMSGIELAHAIASDARISSIPVLILTARGHLLHEGEARSANIVGVVHKPFSPRALLAEVVSILATQRPEQERSAA
ncbi:MAG: Alkaline phosphatase synthesis transcriptional regulatory protein PhoP [Planctomycetota bacterium]